jgi:hypothetical protein
VTRVSAGLIGFDCGYVQVADSGSSASYQDGLTAHAAGHVFFRYGEYGTALRCMEFASDRDVAWADRDAAVIEVAMGVEDESSAARHPGRRLVRPLGIVTLALAILAGFLSGTFASSTAAPPQPPRPAAVTTTAPPAPASPDRAVTEIVSGRATFVLNRNERGGVETAVIPDRPGAADNERRIELKSRLNMRLLATLRSSGGATCRWRFVRGTEPAGPTAAYEVGPGASEQVNVSSGRAKDMTAIVTSSGSPTGCLLVEPGFQPESTQHAPPMRPTHPTTTTVSTPTPTVSDEASAAPSSEPPTQPRQTPPSATTPGPETEGLTPPR